MTLSEHIPEFLRHIRFIKRMSQHSVISYQTDLDQFRQFMDMQFGDIAITEISHIHIRSWVVDLSEKGLAAPSLRRKISTLRSFFKHLLRSKAITSNPTIQVPALKVPKRLPVYLNEQQTEQMSAEIQYSEGWEGETERMIMELLYQTGIRRAELANIKEADISFSRKVIYILGKRNKERMIPVSDELLRDVKGYIEEKRRIFEKSNDYLLVLKSGRPVYAQYIYRTVQKYLSRATTLSKKSPHVLRHTFATQLSNNGAELNAIKELLGHSSLAATQIYTHNNIERLKEIYRKTHPKS